MKNIERDWNTINGYQESRFGGGEGGIVQDQEIWQANIPVGLTFGRVLIIGNTCYVYGDTHTIYSIQLETGTLNWSCNIPEDRLMTFSICGVEGYIVVESYVIDSNKGEIYADLRDYTGELLIAEGEGIAIHGSRVYKQIDSIELPGLVLVFNLDTKDHEVINTGMIGGLMPRNDLIGWKHEEEGYSLSKYSVLNGSLEILCRNIGLGTGFTENNLFLNVTEKEIHLFDIEAKKTVWTRSTDSISDTINPEYITGYNFSICDFTIIISDGKKLSVLNKNTGETLWLSEIGMAADNNCIVGDLIYGHHGINQENSLYALDKFTGEMVWSNNADSSWCGAVAKGNKVLYVGVHGQISCYGWQEPYYSPARPT